MAGTPLETYRPFEYLEDSVAVPLDCPEGIWTTIMEVYRVGLPNGTYIINGAATYSASTANKAAQGRVVKAGVAGDAVSITAGAATDVDYLPFRSYVVVTSGVLDFKVEMQTAVGGGTDAIQILSTNLDYERKLEP